MNTSTKNVLIVTTVSGFVPQFEMNNVKILQSMGYTVYYAANYTMPVYTDNNSRLDGTGIIRKQINFVRSPFSLKNIKAYSELKKLIEEEHFSVIHCHTPMGGVIGRLVGRRESVLKIVYTAHGFHFYHGAPLVNWFFYYPVERMLAKFTDVLITINKEDYIMAKRFKLRNKGKVEYIQGIGINTCDIYKKNDTKESLLHIKESQIVLTSVGELSKRKNHEVILKAIERVVKNNPNIVYVICGTGSLENRLRQLVSKLHISEHVIFMGYCENVQRVLNVTDCFVFPSLQEGLPVAVLEAMNARLPVICSDIRGNRDLIIDGKGGYLVQNQSVDMYVNRIEKLIQNRNLRDEFGRFNLERVKQFDTNIITKKMTEIYEELLEDTHV